LITAEELAGLAAQWAEEETRQRRQRQADGRQWSFSSATSSQIEDALRHVPNNDAPYDFYVRMMMATKNGLGDVGEGAFDSWSRQSQKYSEAEQSKYWRSIKAEGGITVATLFYEALKHGWQGTKSSRNGKSDRTKLPKAHKAEDPDADELQGPETDPPAKYSDLSLANRLITEHGLDLLYIKAEADWYVYSETEHRWKRDEKLFIFTLTKRLIVAAAQELYHEVYNAIIAKKGDTPDGQAEARKAAKSAAASIATAAKVAAVEKMARSDPRVATTTDVFDSDRWMINTADGAVNLRDGTIRPARRKDYFTKVTPVAAERMPTPIFDKFIREIMGGSLPPDACPCAACKNSTARPQAEREALHLQEIDELVKYQFRVYGYCLSGDVKEHMLVVQVGAGGNGKGALNDLISQDVMGRSPAGYSAELPIEALLAHKYDRHPCDLMMLRGARLALSRESDEVGSFNESRVKKLTGADPITARGMRENFVTWDPTHKVVVFTNVHPRLQGADQPAWKRRLHIQRFPQQFAQEADQKRNVLPADLELADKLRGEAAGILQRLIDGCVERCKLGSTKPPRTIRLATDEYLQQQNLVQRFCEERCKRGEAFETTATVLWAGFTQWAQENDEPTGRRVDFNDRLEKAGIKITRQGGTGLRGICNGITLADSPTSQNEEKP
jgi:P4 family phage/plasmid primase-like protien